ncbi:uncharacterized protein LOC143865836 [Tasmannia lanceolata]|uniref:uncharacterized protein LOC143865792 n=1 Tax=Tasmannia lanceolata TaxID=3420 RepID=UPI004062E23D
MGVDAKDIVVYVRKGVIFSIKTCYRSLCDHPFVWVMVFWSLLLYIFFPSVFGFFVSSSPIIVCTAVLLGTLLSFGQPNIPQAEEEEKRSQEISSLKAGGVPNDLVVKKDESFSLESHVEKRREIEEKVIRKTDMGKQGNVRGSKMEKGVVSSKTHDAAEVLIGKNVSIEGVEKEIHGEKKVIEDEEFHEKQIEDVVKVEEDGQGQSTEHQRKEIDKSVDEIVDTRLDGHIDSSSWKKIDDHDEASDSGSDYTESSSPDASMDSIMPMLDELHPLLDSEAPKPTHISVDDSDSISQGSSPSNESDGGSVELAEEAENQEEEEEAHEDQRDGTAVMVTWTEDDEKNLKDLGTSEIERNQRLENLIAKRKARKNRRFESEKNLIELDSNESAHTGTSISEELTRLQFQIPSVSTTRHNPFDLPYGSDDISGLLPIPGSAPSVLLPRRNPFDLPYDHTSERGTLMGESLGQQESLTMQQREIYFRRHESFTLRASFPGEIRQEKNDVRLKPFFVLERFVSEEAAYTTYQRQLSDKSDSKMSSVPETDTSSVVDREERKELLEQDLNLEGELISPTNRAAEPVEQESQSSEEVDSVEIEQEQSDSGETDSSASDVNEDHQDTDALEMVKDEIIHEEETSTTISDIYVEHGANKVYVESELVEEKHEGSSSYSSKVNEKYFEMNTNEGSGNLEQTKGGSSKWSSESVLSAVVDSDLLSRGVEGIDDGQVVEPVYDSSPSAIEKTLSNMTAIEEDLFYVNGGILNSTSSIASSTHIEISGGLPSMMPFERNTIPRGGESILDDGNAKKEMTSSNERLWFASPNLSAVDENESRSREVTEINECDVIQSGFAGVSQQHDNSTAPESTVDQVLDDSSSSSSESELTVDGLMDEEAYDWSLESQVSSSNLFDNLTSFASERIQPLTGESAVLPSFKGGLEESQRDLSGEINDDNNENEFHEPEDNISSKVPPLISVLGRDSSSVDIIEQNESMESSIFLETKSEVVEDRSAEFDATERHLESFILVRSAKEVEAALNKSMTQKTGTSTEEPSAGKPGDEAKEISDDLSSSDEKHKNAVSGKSTSSSSSSSSSSSNHSDREVDD